MLRAWPVATRRSHLKSFRWFRVPLILFHFLIVSEVTGITGRRGVGEWLRWGGATHLGIRLISGSIWMGEWGPSWVVSSMFLRKKKKKSASQLQRLCLFKWDSSSKLTSSSDNPWVRLSSSEYSYACSSQLMDLNIWNDFSCSCSKIYLIVLRILFSHLKEEIQNELLYVPHLCIIPCYNLTNWISDNERAQWMCLIVVVVTLFSVIHVDMFLMALTLLKRVYLPV